MAHEKANYRKDADGKVKYQDQGGDGEEASLQDRVAIGRHQDGSHYLRAADGEDLRAIKQAAGQAGVQFRQRRGGASHFGRIGTYEHVHFDSPEDAKATYDQLGSFQKDPTTGKVSQEDDPGAALAGISGAMRGHAFGGDDDKDEAVADSHSALIASKKCAKGACSHQEAAEAHGAAAEAHEALSKQPGASNHDPVKHAGIAAMHRQLADFHASFGPDPMADPNADPDADGDGQGPDADGDGDGEEAVGGPDTGQDDDPNADPDGDGVPNAQDPDKDGDGTIDPDAAGKAVKPKPEEAPDETESEEE